MRSFWTYPLHESQLEHRRSILEERFFRDPWKTALDLSPIILYSLHLSFCTEVREHSSSFFEPILVVLFKLRASSSSHHKWSAIEINHAFLICHIDVFSASSSFDFGELDFWFFLPKRWTVKPILNQHIIKLLRHLKPTAHPRRQERLVLLLELICWGIIHGRGPSILKRPILLLLAFALLWLSRLLQCTSRPLLKVKGRLVLQPFDGIFSLSLRPYSIELRFAYVVRLQNTRGQAFHLGVEVEERYRKRCWLWRQCAVFAPLWWIWHRVEMHLSLRRLNGSKLRLLSWTQIKSSLLLLWRILLRCRLWTVPLPKWHSLRQGQNWSLHFLILQWSLMLIFEGLVILKPTQPRPLDRLTHRPLDIKRQLWRTS